MGRRGLLLRRLDVIERLAKAQMLFVDRTGSLTEGSLRCVEVQRLDDTDPANTEALQAETMAPATQARIHAAAPRR